ncbi:MAG: histidine phosphatase family protein [Pyrinomonadaceae bacterium]
MSTQLGPKQVLIIRHGEKVGDPKKDNDGGRNLSVRGSARAAALPALFVPATPQSACRLHQEEGEFVGSYQQIPLKGVKPRFATPGFIFATARSKHSKRPIETVMPLSTALAVHINDGFADNDTDIKEMVDAILNEGAFAGKVVLICWHHGKIPDIAKALGIPRPPKWDGKVFDRVWQITFPKGKATLDNLPQMLLYGDSDK